LRRYRKRFDLAITELVDPTYRERAMPKKWTWIVSPKSLPKPAVPEDLKAEVKDKATALVEEFLKPQFIKPPPKNWRWNYINDIFTKWQCCFFYSSPLTVAVARPLSGQRLKRRLPAWNMLASDVSTSPTCGTPINGGRSIRIWL
jgi:hypothetical protein